METISKARRVLDVGNCRHDHGLIRRMLESSFRVAIDRAQVLDDAIDAIRTNEYDLVLVNRILDRNGTEGLDIIRRLKADDRTKRIPVMLISNYDWAQAAAVEAGALRGFGKAELGSEATLTRLREILA
jgi:CheY-like chemotaxis protein